MDKKKLLATLIAAAVAAPAVNAMTDKEMEARFQKYEAQVKALQAEVKDLKANGGVVYVQDMEKQTKRNTAQIDSIKAKMDADNEKLKMNGFMTAAVSMGDDPVDAGYEIQDNPNFRGDAKAGLQFNYNLGENSSAVVQMVARSRGGEPWEVNAEWAYLNYGLSENLNVRMGRLRLPLYLQSETLDVGYSYPWVRPPIELYQTSITSYEGADMLYKFATGSVNHTLQPFVGSSLNHSDTDTPYGRIGVVNLDADPEKEMFAEVQLDFKDVYGVTMNSTLGNWTTKLTAMHLGIDGKIVASDNSFAVAHLLNSAIPNVGAGETISEADDNLMYFAVGGMYDNGSLLAMTEIAHIKANDDALLADGISGHATLGYRIDRWTPYTTYAWAQSNSDMATNKSMKSISLGLRRELTDKLSAKMEWNNYFELQNNGNYGSGANSLAGSLGDDANVYTFALDAVF